MRVFALFEVEVNESATEEAKARYAEYRAAVPELIARFGGRYLARAAPGRAIEGRPTDGRWHLIEFPDATAADAFWASPEYEALKPLRVGAAEVRAVIVEP